MAVHRKADPDDDAVADTETTADADVVA